MRYQIENGTVSLGGKTILNHIDFSIKGQEKIAVVGRNGAGKTTLLQMICGIIEPTSGEVKIDGENNIQMGERFRDILGYLPQEFGYTPSFTRSHAVYCFN